MSTIHADRDYYREAYESDRDAWSEMTQLDRRTRRWLRALDGTMSDPKRMLDLGTGHGRIAGLFAREGFRAVGIDYLPEAVQEAASRENGRADFLAADAFKLPFVPGAFKVIVDYGLLHHVRKSSWPDYRSLVLDQLEENGYYFVSVFHETDGHADRETRSWVYHRNHYDRFFTRSTLDDCLGPDLDCVESDLIHDGDHTFLHALYERA